MNLSMAKGDSPVDQRAASSPSRIVAVVALAWLGTVALGTAALWNYAAKGGKAGQPPTRFPTGTYLQRSAGKPTLIMTMHPLCPCSRASLSELSEIMSRAADRLVAYVLVPTPLDVDRTRSNELVEQARAIPGVRVVRDLGGAETRRFHALTSGDVALYDAAGRFRFSGGITGSRGHAGLNEGRASILALLAGRPASLQTSVFGCPLFPEGSQ
jgi:hypothetical protein